MSKHRTVEELYAAAQAAEERAKKLREQARKQTQAERAKVNADIIKAVEEWQDSLPESRRVPWEKLPQEFRRWAANNRQKYGSAEQGKSDDGFGKF